MRRHVISRWWNHSIISCWDAELVHHAYQIVSSAFHWKNTSRICPSRSWVAVKCHWIVCTVSKCRESMSNKHGLCTETLFLSVNLFWIGEEIRAPAYSPPKTRGLHEHPSQHTHDIQRTMSKVKVHPAYCPSFKRFEWPDKHVLYQSHPFLWCGHSLAVLSALQWLQHCFCRCQI